MARFFTGGIPVNGDTLAAEAIDRVGSGEAGEIFLTDDHTFDHFLKAQFHPRLLDRSRYDAWLAAGGKDAAGAAREEARRILDEHVVASKPPDVLAAVQGVLDSTG